MASKASDKMKELRERASAMITHTPGAPASAPALAPADPAALSPAPTSSADISAHFGIAPLDQITSGRVVQSLPVGHIAPDTRPGARQSRLLPLPEELIVDDKPAPGYADLVAALRELGRSLLEQQIQPIIVYPGTSAIYPAARYLILVGHRRWTAACLVGMPEIDAVVVDPPTPIERVRLQYVENEDRADFSDMERVWALQQMKQALGDAPWEAVEERFQISRGRRQELLRLIAFTPEQQIQIARLRLRETQLRPLHTAIRTGELTGAQADQVLAQLIRLAKPIDMQAEGMRSMAIDGPTIARVVARAKRSSAQQPTPQWLPLLCDQIERIDKGVTRARKRFEELNDADATMLIELLSTLIERTNEAVEDMRRSHGNA